MLTIVLVVCINALYNHSYIVWRQYKLVVAAVSTLLKIYQHFFSFFCVEF